MDALDLYVYMRDLARSLPLKFRSFYCKVAVHLLCLSVQCGIGFARYPEQKLSPSINV